MSENETMLLRRFAMTGDAQAFSEIARRHAGLVYAACLRVLRDQTTAADIVQETFLQLVRDAGRITGSVAGWLHRVATRKALDAARSDRHRREREAKYAAQRLHETENWEYLSLYVDDALDELDEEMKEILIEHFFEGRTTTEIAADKDISQPTASRRIESAVSVLRTKLHNRGVLVAAAALGSLLAQNAAEAAPAFVLKELGKIAMVGAQAVAAAGAAGTTASAAATTAATAGALSGVTAKIITAAAVAAVGVGSVVTYNHLTAPVEQPKHRAPVARPVERAESRRWAETLRPQEPAGTAAMTPEAREARPATPYRGPDQVVTFSEPDETVEAAPDTRARVAPAAYGGYGGGYGVMYVPPPEGAQEPGGTDSNTAPDGHLPPPPPGGSK